jgi:hypothetical protein
MGSRSHDLIQVSFNACSEVTALTLQLVIMCACMIYSLPNDSAASDISCIDHAWLSCMMNMMACDHEYDCGNLCSLYGFCMGRQTVYHFVKRFGFS